MFIETSNNLAEQSQQTFLAFPEAAGTTSIRVQNTTGLTTSWGIQIGNTAEDRTEVVIGTVSAFGSITLPALSFDHPAGAPVFFIKYNQVVFERSTTGTTGVAAPISSGTIGYQASEFTTKFDDTSGTTTYGYKTFFRNSALAVNSTESAWLNPQAGLVGLPVYSLGGIRGRIRGKLPNSSFVLDNELNSWINEHLETMNSAAVAVNEDYSLGTNTYSFGTAGLGTITDELYKAPRRLWVTYDGQTYYQARKMFYNDYLPNQQFNSTQPYFSMPGDNVFEIQPAGAGGSALVAYYKNATVMNDDDDLLPFPMRGYSKSFVDYGLAMSLQKDTKTQEANALLQSSVNPAISNFRQEIAPRIQTGPTMIRLTEVINGEDFY
jgi:hypothetical protein